jgi:hypothetical protein
MCRLTFLVHYVLVPFMTLSQPSADAANINEPAGQNGPDGEDAWAAAREARHQSRINHLELLRNIGMEIAAGLGHAAARRHQFDTSAFARITDPAASFNRLSLAIRRIVALEELLEEDAATRAAQLAAQRALQERRAARERAEEEKQIVRRTVRMAHSDANPGIERDRQENLLNDLFDNYELYNEGPLAEVVANICTDLGLIPDLRHWGEAPEEGCEPDPVKIRARTLETAAEYLELVMNPGAAPPGDGGHGPPDG